MSVSAAICGFRVSARSHGDTKAPASVVTICLLLSTFGASHGGGKACRLLGSESTVSLTTFCEAEDVHKKGRVLCGRCSLARSPPLWPQGRATHLHSAARDTRRRSSAKRSFLQVRIRYKTVCLPKSAFTRCKQRYVGTCADDMGRAARTWHHRRCSTATNGAPPMSQ